MRDRDKKFRLLFEEHPQPMWIFDPECLQVLEANPAAAALYGYSRDEFRGMALADIQGPAARPAAGTWRHRTASGRVIEVDLALHEIRYGGHEADLVVLTDVTDRRHLEDQLRQAQKMEAVGMLAGGVAHDFNNLLTIITGYCQLILLNLAPNDPNRPSAEQIMKAGERAAALTKQLLAFSRQRLQQPKVLELNGLVASLGAMLQRVIGEDIELRLALLPDLGRVHADPGHIEQVLMNLVVNARDAMPNGGTLTIATANASLEGGYANRHVAVKPGPYVLLTVSDNGTGMDEATQARLFEPFFTTKGAEKGTGLGLSTVLGIVKQTRGAMEISSAPGRGTSVKVYLPRIDQPVVVESQVPKTRVARGSETVLLVEDDDILRNLLRETLEREGYQVLDAPGPTAARRLAKSHRGPIQILITDMVLPKGSGRELARQLVHARPELKVLCISGYADSAVAGRGSLEADAAFLQKPFTPASLAEKVREVLGGGKSNQAGK